MLKEIVNHNKIKFLANLWIVVLTIFMGVNMVSATGNGWEVVGKVGFSATDVSETAVKLDSNNVPYILFAYKNYGAVAVLKYDGASWAKVGSTVFSGYVLRSSLAFDSSNVPYVAYQDVSNSNKLNIVKYDALTSKWVNVGTAGFAKGQLYESSLVFDSNNVPYVAFTDDANDGISVMKYDGSKWVNVGTAGFVTWGITHISLVFDSNNKPYVSFTNVSDSGKASVMKYDGSKWVNVGSSGFSPINVRYVSLRLDSKNNPYVAFTDNNDKVSVMKYDSSSSKWVNVGTAGFSATTAQYTSLVIDSNDIPYVGFSRMNSGSDFIEVMRYDGSSWVSVGTAGFSQAGAWYTSLVIDSNDVLYIGFKDGNAYLSPGNFGSTVMKNEDFKKKEKTWKVAGNNGSVSGNSEIVSIISDPNNTKYVAFGDNDENDKATVIQYDGVSSWSRVGRAGFTPDRADWVSLAKNTYGTPYVAYSDYSRKDANNVGKASVMRYLGGTAGWVNIGNAGFSSYGAEYTRLALDKKDVPYVAFIDNNPKLNNPVTVMKYDSSISKWVPVGVPGFSNGTAWYPYITFDNLNTPYVSYRDQATGKAVVVKFDGRKWVKVGPTGFTIGSVDHPQIKFDTNNNLYISFQDWNQGGKVTVMKYDGIAAWTVVGTPGFSKEESYGVSLFIHNNVPYVSFSYIANYSGKTEDGITVMKYDSSRNTWDEVGANPISVPASYTNILVDKLGVPYVVAPGDPLIIMKFD